MVDATVGLALTTEGAAAIGASIAIAGGTLAAAWSQGTLGAAALGVAAERPEFEKSVMLYVVLPEVLAVFGFLIAILLWMQMGGTA